MISASRLPALMLSGLLALPAQADDLLDTARRAGTFKNFIEAVRVAGLTRQLKADGPYTLFIPSDNAIDSLPDGQWQALLKDRERLARVLRYHIVSGKMKVAEVKPGPVPTDEGKPLRLTSDNGMVTVNGARVTESDLAADNGIIHAIDDVLLPPD
jgi:uncharacterized surface protein with fasciclin (FAS1) repeats